MRSKRIVLVPAILAVLIAAAIILMSNLAFADWKASFQQNPQIATQSVSPSGMAAIMGFNIVEVDKIRIGQVISNLLSNAFKFTTEGTIVVNIRRDQTNKEGTVSVKDSGKGIDPEVVPRLFEKFASKSFQGTGLGLFISRSIIEAHGGKIWAENNNKIVCDRKGATFFFTLPIQPT